MAVKSLSEILGGVTSFGRLTVVGESPRLVDKRGKAVRRARCKCECGSITDVYVSALRKLVTRSCGCLQREKTGERARRHGDVAGGEWSREYQCWAGMIQRCTNPNTKTYAQYGGRGIEVCERWRGSFILFLGDMGRKPTKQHSIERINNDGNYEPGNCRWADKSTQMRNRRVTRMIHWQGRDLCLQDAAKEVGLPQSTLFNRLRLGWTVDRAMTTPKLHRA